jgi:hypothetical protein
MKWKCVPDQHMSGQKRATVQLEKELTGESDPASGTYIVGKNHQRRLHAHRIEDLSQIPRAKTSVLVRNHWHARRHHVQDRPPPP